MTKKNIIVALDDPLDYQSVLEVLDPRKCILKVGSIIFNYHGRKILKNSAIVDKFGMYVPNHTTSFFACQSVCWIASLTKLVCLILTQLG